MKYRQLKKRLNDLFYLILFVFICLVNHELLTNVFLFTKVFGFSEIFFLTQCIFKNIKVYLIERFWCLFFLWNDAFLLVDQILILHCLFFSCKTRSLILYWLFFSCETRSLSSSFIFIVPFKRCYGQISGRSGLALNDGTTVHNGMIDSNYRGKLGTILFNHSNKEYCKNWWSSCSIDHSVIHCQGVWLSQHISKAWHGEGR